MEKKRKKIFISHAHETYSELKETRHIDFLEEFIEKLKKRTGLDVICDIKNNPSNIVRFMNSSIELCDYGVIIYTTKYKAKIDKGLGGANKEYEALVKKLMDNNQFRLYCIVLEPLSSKDLPSLNSADIAYLFTYKLKNCQDQYNKFISSIQKKEEVSEQKKTEVCQQQYNFYGYEKNFAIASLISSWDDQNEGDIKILKNIFGDNYDTWIDSAREVLNEPDNNIVNLNNGVWEITQTKELYNTLSNYIFDDRLDNFKQIALEVLKEENPAFELTKDKRWAANIYGKNLNHSNNLREGLAKGLAILGNTKNPTNCNVNKQEYITNLSIHEILLNANWQLWGSLNDVMPILAEASPKEFLSQIEQDLESNNPEIPKLFQQESDAITGRPYLTGLLWGLEALAWDNELLVRACAILATLANVDPGGQWSNRPVNSIKTILLPWSPQTIATINKRKTAINTICDEYPDVGWDVLISFLPNKKTTTSESYKPRWRDTIPNDWKKEVTHQEYWEQTDYCARKLILLAENKVDKLKVLIDNASNLPKQSFDNLLKFLSSTSILDLSEDNRLILWQRLIKLISRHKSYPDSGWSLSNGLLTKVESVANKLKPSDLSKLHQHLFSYNYNYNYPHKTDENHEQREEKIAKIRKNAIEEILTTKGIESVIEFAKIIEYPSTLGNSLALIRTNEIDNALFPKLLSENKNKLSEFISEYVRISFYKGNWQWVDKLIKDNWDVKQKSQFLTSLPFRKETWNKAKNWLKDKEELYWVSVDPNPYYDNKNLNYAIEKLLQHKRPEPAINCLSSMNYNKENINIELCVRALIDAMSSQELNHSMDYYHIVELIKVLQENEKTSLQDIIKIEWYYLPLLDGHRGARPIILENKLANNSEFFCEVIQLMYRSKDSLENKKEATEYEKNIADNAYHLLNNWKTAPGVDKQGIFNKDNFNNWLARTKEICAKSDHLDIALIKIGRVLVNSPEDSSGLWINKTIAIALNEKNARKMREGYRSGIFNSRGVHKIDPTGKPELELSEKYADKANKVEDAGFHRLAIILRDLSRYYKNETKQIIDS
jgi:hypothetical protein